MTVEKHPKRYPKHNGDKGQILGGECNRTACTRMNAVFYNSQTFAYYCTIDARAINDSNGLPICTRADHQLSLDEQDEAYRTFSKPLPDL